MLKKELLTFEQIIAKDNPEIKQIVLSGRETITQYFKDHFQEFEEGTLDQLFEVFGIKKDKLLIFYSHTKAGFLAIQSPNLDAATAKPEDASATFAMYMDGRTGHKVFSFSGITELNKNHKHIIAAKYYEVPEENGYKLVSHDIGQHEGKHPGGQPIRQGPTSALITPKMIALTGNNFLYHIPSAMGTLEMAVKSLPFIPNRLKAAKINA